MNRKPIYSLNDNVIVNGMTSPHRIIEIHISHTFIKYKLALVKNDSPIEKWYPEEKICNYITPRFKIGDTIRVKDIPNYSSKIVRIEWVHLKGNCDWLYQLIDGDKEYESILMV